MSSSWNKIGTDPFTALGGQTLGHVSPVQPIIDYANNLPSGAGWGLPKTVNDQLHVKQNGLIRNFVVANTTYLTSPGGLTSYYPENGRHLTDGVGYYPNSEQLRIPTAVEVKALFRKIQDKCCIQTK